MKDILMRLTDAYPELEEIIPKITAAYKLLADCYDSGHKLLLCGNGGSASDCEHIAGELLKGFTSRRMLPEELRTEFIRQGAGEHFIENLQGSLPAISLVSQTAFATAFLNDVNPLFIFAQQVYGLGQEGDVLLAISTSGNSQNIQNAAIVARQKGLKVIGMTGKHGGGLERLSDAAIKVPAEDTYRIQEYHLPVYHAICEMIEKRYWS